MKRLTRNLFIGAVGATAVAGGGYYYFNTHYNNKNVETVKKLSASEFNALQNQKLLKEALLPSHLPWNYAEQRAKLSKTNNKSAPGDGGKQMGGQTDSAVIVPHNKNDFDLYFYRLLGCPYCAKVQALLQFYKVPYTEIRIDPLSGSGLPDLRYDLAPQLGLQRKAPVGTADAAAAAAAEERVYIVDSAYIMEKLAVPLRFSETIMKQKGKGNNNTEAEHELQKTRNWITHHFQGASFALTNSTPMNAFYGFDYVAPEGRKQSLVYKVFGSAALYILSTLKIKPKVQNLTQENKTADTKNGNSNNNNDNNKEKDGDRGASEAKEVMIHYFQQQQQQQQSKGQEDGKAPAELHFPKDPKEWLCTELNVFLARRPPRATNASTNNKNNAVEGAAATATFHGGETPDLADVEMYGVTRVVAAHPVLGQVLRENKPFRAWEEHMESYIQPL